MDKVISYFLSWVRRCFIFAFLPLFLAFKSIVHLRKKSLARFGFLFLLFIIFSPLWATAYLITGLSSVYILGMYENTIRIAGTGSMYPTFPIGVGLDHKVLASQVVAEVSMQPYPNGIRIAELNLLGHEIERGDLISAENDLIRQRIKKAYGVESGIVKRVIATPGDRILLKDGLVYLNGKVLIEPYVAGDTIGGDFLKESEEIEIPQGKLFVMGDNRKGSYDSRHFGFIRYQDVDHVLAFQNQSEKISLASTN